VSWLQGDWGLLARVLLASRQAVGCPRTESNKEQHYQLTTPKRWLALLISSEELLYKFWDQLIALTFLYKNVSGCDLNDLHNHTNLYI
jgi:hypothetical protein